MCLYRRGNLGVWGAMPEASGTSCKVLLEEYRCIFCVLPLPCTKSIYPLIHATSTTSFWSEHERELVRTVVVHPLKRTKPALRVTVLCLFSLVSDSTAAEAWKEYPFQGSEDVSALLRLMQQHSNERIFMRRKLEVWQMYSKDWCKFRRNSLGVRRESRPCRVL